MGNHHITSSKWNDHGQETVIIYHFSKEDMKLKEGQSFMYKGIEHVIISDELLPVISNDITNNTKLIEYYFKSK